jgi:phosphatidylserine decarboxylase
MMWALGFLPRNLISLWAGLLMHIELPYALKVFSMETFAKFYNINVAEAEKPLEEYKSIGDFFVRKLKRGARPLAMTEVVHPADSVLTAFRKIENGELIQVKGKHYRVEAVAADPKGAEYYENGFFGTYYLCPTDYHRVHSPVAGKILSVTHVPGDLWPVHAASVGSVENLFGINERVIIKIETFRGVVTVIFVGALNVGKIELDFEPSISTNNLKEKVLRRIDYSEPKSIDKGAELGMFRMGSTVVVLYPKAFSEIAKIDEKMDLLNSKIKVNSAFF